VAGSHSVLEEAMNLWHDEILGGDDIPPAFSKGRTFVGCTSPQGLLTASVKSSKAKADAATAVEAANRLNRKEEKANLERTVKLYAMNRGVYVCVVCLVFSVLFFY
jgi:hypothetical protein